jgi:hypothetical protein
VKFIFFLVVLFCCCEGQANDLNEYDALFRYQTEAEQHECYAYSGDLHSETYCASVINKIRYLLGYIWVEGDELRKIKFFKTMWSNPSGRMMGSPYVRLKLAYCLGQLKWLDPASSMNATLKKYVLEYVNSEKVVFRDSAIEALGIVGDKSDIDYLTGVAVSGNTPAISAIADILEQKNNYEPVLKLIYKSTNSRQVKSYIEQYLEN